MMCFAATTTIRKLVLISCHKFSQPSLESNSNSRSKGKGKDESVNGNFSDLRLPSWHFLGRNGCGSRRSSCAAAHAWLKGGHTHTHNTTAAPPPTTTTINNKL